MNDKKQEKIFQIPYAVHEERMMDAYDREKFLIRMLCFSNFVWIISLLLFAVLR